MVNCVLQSAAILNHSKEGYYMAKVEYIDYKKLKELEGKEDIWWAVFLGADGSGAPDGHDGIFVWQGGISTMLDEGDVNAVREMTSYISCSTAPEMLATE